MNWNEKFWDSEQILLKNSAFFCRYLQREIVNKKLIYKSAAMHHVKLHLVLSWKHYRNSQKHLVFTLKTAVTFAGSVIRHPVLTVVQCTLFVDLSFQRADFT